MYEDETNSFRGSRVKMSSGLKLMCIYWSVLYNKPRPTALNYMLSNRTSSQHHKRAALKCPVAPHCLSFSNHLEAPSHTNTHTHTRTLSVRTGLHTHTHTQRTGLDTCSLCVIRGLHTSSAHPPWCDSLSQLTSHCDLSPCPGRHISL